MSDNLPVAQTQQESWDDMLPVAASNKAIQRYNAVVNFAVQTLKFGTHYDVLPAEYYKCKGKSDAEILQDTSIKKFFTQAGADMTNMAWGVRGEAEVVHQIEQPDAAEPYFAYAIKVNLYHIGTGKIVGSAVGYCSSKEVKFRYRWVKENDLKDDPAFADVDLKNCKSKVFGWGKDQTRKYRVINPDLGDIAPTIFMMAEKRGYVKATRRLYGISELFNQSLDSIEESLLTEIDADAGTKPPAPERSKLADADMKPGDPAKHQAVDKPQGESQGSVFNGSAAPKSCNDIWTNWLNENKIKPKAKAHIQMVLMMKRFSTDDPLALPNDMGREFQAWLDGLDLSQL